MPKNKKPRDSSSDSDSGPDDKVPVKKSKSEGGGSSSKRADSGGEPTWILEKMRHVKVREFRGKMLVDIREYYEKDGNLLPGKKGISLSASQWKTLCEVMPEINEELKKS